MYQVHTLYEERPWAIIMYDRCSSSNVIHELSERDRRLMIWDTYFAPLKTFVISDRAIDAER